MAGPNEYNLNNVDEIFVDGLLGNNISLDITKNYFLLGNKVIEVSDSAADVNLNITGGVDGQVGYAIDGDDLIINIYGTKKDWHNNTVANPSITLGTIRLVDGATSKFDDTERNFFVNQDENPLFSTAYNSFERGDTDTEEKQILKGSYLSEKFYCGKGNDEVYTGLGGGDEEVNTVYLNTGNATIYVESESPITNFISMEDTFTGYDYLGKPEYEYYYPQKSIFSKGGSTLIGATANDTIQAASFYDGESYKYLGDVKFYRKGNDLAIFNFIPRSYDYYGVEKRYYSAYEARLNVKDYYMAESKVVVETGQSAGDVLAQIDDAMNLIEGKGKLKGTFNSEAIVANAKSTIYTGKGDDEIYLSTGNDTVIVDGDGYKTIFASGATGNNTIQINNKNAYVDVEILGINGDRNYINYQLDFSKSGNNLVIKPGYSYGTPNYEKSFNPAYFSGESSIIVKDYFKNYYGLHIVGNYVVDILENETFTINGNAKNENTIYGTNYNDVITGGKKKDVIYTGSGDDIINSTAGTDKIVINGTGEKEINIDKGNVVIDWKNTSSTIDIVSNAPSSPFYKKNGKDLTVYMPAFANGFTLNSATIKNAFNSDGTVMSGISFMGTDINNTVIEKCQYIQGKGNIKYSDEIKDVLVAGSSKADTITIDTNETAIVMSGKGNDKVTVKNSSEGGVITDAGNDTIDLYSCDLQMLIAGKGNDKINFKSEEATANMMFMDGDGNDTITFNSIPTDGIGIFLYKSMTTGPNNDYTYTKSGNNLIITKPYTDSKGKIKNDTITIKDYFGTNHDNLLNKIVVNSNGIESHSSGDIYAKGLILKGTYNKKTKTTYFVDSKYRDIIIGTSKKDDITLSINNLNTAGAKETITAGKGNDTININAMSNVTLNFANGDGNDTIKFDTTKIFDPSLTSVDIKFTGKNNAQGYTQSGNDLVIHNVYELKGNIKTDSVVVKDFYDLSKEISDMTNGSDFDYRYYNFAKDKITNHSVNDKALIVTGTKADTIEANNEAIIYSGKGNDKITVKDNAQIYAGKGNDTITIDGGSLQNVELNVSKGDGNDTIVANSEYNYLTINLNGYISDSIEDINFLDIRNLFETKKFGFKTSGEDLVFYRPNGKKQETITFKGALASDSNFSTNNIKLNFTNKNDEFSISMSSLADGVLPVIGKKQGGTMVYTGAEDIGCVFNYSGSGKALMNGGNGDDTYIATLNKNSKLLIADRGTNSHDDSLKINAKSKDVCLFFDVAYNENGDGKASVGSGIQALYIFNKNSLNENSFDDIHYGNWSGIIEVGTYFGRDGEGNNEGMDADDAMQIYKGSGKIENLQIKNDYIDMEGWIYQVGFEVAQWMSQHTEYGAYASTVLKQGSPDDIQALLAIYKNNTADMYAMDMNGYF
ncbi:hypothetical protein IJ182_06240 [bacterium]|nr:hypothetical protein [bacterium]